MKPYNWRSPNIWNNSFAHEYCHSHIDFSESGRFHADVSEVALKSMDDFMLRSKRGKMGKIDGRVVILYFGSDLTKKEIGRVVNYKESEIRKAISDFTRHVQLEYEKIYRDKEKTLLESLFTWQIKEAYHE